VPDTDPEATERSGFFQEVLGDQTDAPARKAAKAKNPWWLPPSQVRHYNRMAGAYFALAAAAFIASFFVGPGAVTARTFAGLWLVMSAWHLLSAVMLRRRARRGQAVAAPSMASAAPVMNAASSLSR
jgi:hypothetical protein